jgi:hypothetical protein
MPTNYCRHIRPNGRRCQMLALRNKPFCYHHESVNAHHRALNPPEDHPEIIIHPINPGADNLQREPILAEYLTPARAPLAVRFPALEDADSIQVSLSMLLSALGQNRIDTKRATAMAYALQVASINARNLTLNSPTSSPKPSATTPATPSPPTKIPKRSSKPNSSSKASRPSKTTMTIRRPKRISSAAILPPGSV